MSNTMSIATARELTNSISCYPIYDDETIDIIEKPNVQKDADGTYILDAVCRVKTEDFDGTVVYHRSIIGWIYITDYWGGEEGSEPAETFELVKFTSSNGDNLTYKRKIVLGKIEYESLA